MALTREVCSLKLAQAQLAANESAAKMRLAAAQRQEAVLQVQYNVSTITSLVHKSPELQRIFQNSVLPLNQEAEACKEHDKSATQKHDRREKVAIRVSGMAGISMLDLIVGGLCMAPRGVCEAVMACCRSCKQGAAE